MYRQIIIPESNSFLLNLPADFIGRQVEVIAFPIEEEIKEKKASKKSAKDKEIDDFYKSINLDLSHFKFNRDEAHER